MSPNHSSYAAIMDQWRRGSYQNWDARAGLELGRRRRVGVVNQGLSESS